MLDGEQEECLKRKISHPEIMKRGLECQAGNIAPKATIQTSNLQKKARRESRIESLLEFRGRAGIAQDFKENSGACESFSPFDRHEKVKASAQPLAISPLMETRVMLVILFSIQKNSGVDRAESNSPAELQKMSASGNINGIIEGNFLATRRWGFSSCGFRGLTSVGVRRRISGRCR